MVVLKAFVLGVILAVLYDCFRITRKLYRFGKIGIFIQDILFFLLSSLLTILFITAMNEGQLRYLVVLGEIIGAWVYFLTVSPIIMKVINAILWLIRKIFHFIYRFLISPILKLFRLIGKGIMKILNKLTKNREFLKKNPFYPLKKRKEMVYNNKNNS